MSKKTKHVEQVDVFWGTGVTELNRPAIHSPDAYHFADKWSSPKPKQGNLHPGVVLPFHLVSVSPYGGGYPTGYHPQKFQGFTHFHPSGTGWILWFYNYFLMSPVLSDTLKQFTIKKESARPGFYEVVTNEGLHARASVWEYVSYTEFAFPDNQPAKVEIDLTHVYRAPKGKSGFPSEIEYSYQKNVLNAKVVMDGIPIYVLIKPLQAEISSSFAEGTYKWVQQKSDAQLIWTIETTQSELKLATAFSLISFDEAHKRLRASTSLQDAATKAAFLWNEELSRVQMKGISPEIDTLFYSAMYRTLIKPIYAPNDHPFASDVPYFTDFATWWDAYQTQMPLLTLLYPDLSNAMLDYLSESLNRYDYWRTADLFSSQAVTAFDNQGTALAPIAIADVWMRNGAISKTDNLLAGFNQFLISDLAQEYASGTVLGPSPVQHVDYAQAFFMSSKLYASSGNHTLADSLKQLSTYWVRAYDSTRKLLKGDEFYEAGAWNYSFKPWWDKNAFVNFMGGKKALIQQLDTFFGFSEQTADLHFEGLNNEVDMSVPYWYTELGKPHRTQQIIRAVFAKRFGLGRGGLPGNEDSGALSSWIVWNVLGLYPKPAHDAYFIGSPLIHYANIQLKNAHIEIKVTNNSLENGFVGKVHWNGKALENLELSGQDLRAGGILEIWMTHETN